MIRGESIERGNDDKGKGGIDAGASGKGWPTTLSLSDTERVNVIIHAIENIYILIIETKTEVVGKELIKNIIREILDEEINKIREQLQQFVREIMRKESSEMPMLFSGADGNIMKTYIGAVKSETETIIIIKPKETEGENSSETTEKDFKK